MEIEEIIVAINLDTTINHVVILIFIGLNVVVKIILSHITILRVMNVMAIANKNITLIMQPKNVERQHTKSERLKD